MADLGAGRADTELEDHGGRCAGVRDDQGESYAALILELVRNTR